MKQKIGSAGVRAPANKEKTSMKITKKKAPMLDSMSVGAANAPMDRAAGLRSAMPGMKKGGSCGVKKMSCGGAMKGYAKGGSIDGIAHKGKTKGKIC